MNLLASRMKCSFEMHSVPQNVNCARRRRRNNVRTKSPEFTVGDSEAAAVDIELRLKANN